MNTTHLLWKMFHGLVVALVLNACGLTGQTTRETLQIESASLGVSMVPIEIRSVGIELGGNDLVAVGTYEWGRFDQADLENLRGSLEGTIHAAQRSAGIITAEKLRIAVLLRRYIVASSNTALAVLAAVDWCAARSDDSVVYREIFYATAESQNFYSKDPANVRFPPTVGGFKDAVNQAIVRRIAESSLILASGRIAATDLPKKVADTYDNFDDAKASVPARLRSWYPLSLTMPFPVIPVTGPDVPWWNSKSSENRSCQQLFGWSWDD